MEMLPSSGVQYVGESDHSQQNSGTVFIYAGESNSDEHGKQVHMVDGGVNILSLNGEGSQIHRQSDGQGAANGLPLSEGHQCGPSYSDCQVESQKLSGDSHDFEDEDLNVQNSCTKPCEAPENFQVIVDTIESEPTNGRDEESSLSEPKWLEHGESVALWVKWRGKWQAGIRCARADWPLSTLKAKPTHDRKKYFVIFFPHTRNYSWADMLLVRSINEFPQPIAYRTHKIGLKMVKDLNVARRFIMQKLAVGMLNIVDQFHTEALIDTARDVMVWKEFAMEASHCSGYSDLGRMLLKLQNMILQQYVKSDWLEHSFQSWVQRCQVVQSAESIELLREELSDSILWNEVNSLWNAPVQPTLGSEWKTWKHEVMKWFSTSHPVSSSGDVEQRSCDSPLTLSPQVGRKRPKLEVRRSESHASQVETSSPLQTMAVEIDSKFFNNQDNINAANVESEPSKVEYFREGVAPTESRCSVTDKWEEIVVEAGNSELMQTKNIERTPINEVVDEKTLDPGNKNRQCIAFIESKGRQCVRLANDGDVYCCVHLASRFIGSSTKVEASRSFNSPMCEGTTVLGTRCKHRSLSGSSFCKKHRPRIDTTNTSNSPENTLKRKHDEIILGAEATHCKDMVLMGEVESPLQVEPLSVMDRDAFHGRNMLIEKFEHSIPNHSGQEVLHCIGSSPFDYNATCYDTPKRYSLYCDKHMPSWLKRARNGKSRIIPKELFIDLLKDCHSTDQKLSLHRACELFYKLFKSILSLRNPVPMEIQLQWALSEASKDFNIGELLLKLVCAEKVRLTNIWSFSANEDVQVFSCVNEESTILPLAADSSHDDEKSFKCKFCSEEFLDDQELGNHWMDNHKKEAQWLFRGYACAICLDSFTNRKLLETHVQERHHVQFVEQCMLLHCIPCGSHFGNVEGLWLHVLSVHPAEFRLSKVANLLLGEEKENSLQKLEQVNTTSMENNSENLKGIRKFICKFCGLKFDLLPDLGRHHQAAHMGPNLFSSRQPKRGVRYYAYRLKSGRLSRPRFKKGLGATTHRMGNRASASMKKHIQASKSLSPVGLSLQSQVTELATLGRLAESKCSTIAKILFSKIQKTKPRPNNLDILAAARSACCKVSLKASLEGKYGVLPERLYLKVAKLCSEHNIRVKWHQEGFICPRGCKSFKDPGLLSPLMSLHNGFVGKQSTHSSNYMNKAWEVDECHYVIDLYDVREIPRQKSIVLCNDISFGKELIPIACVVDEHLLASLNVFADSSDSQTTNFPMPWESFAYITRPLHDQSHNHVVENLQLGCACPDSLCSPETCDHVYLFDNDYEEARDIYGKLMHGRFPYDDKGRIILEEGYLVYECNHMCRCSKNCPNRVLQKGIRVKLEIFKTKNKGWAVRTVEPILRGTFVCEYIGEVLDEKEAYERRGRYGEQGCRYMYDIDARANDMSRLIEGQVKYVIDATKNGNVSRFINHSCMPNLMNHQVLINSMDSQHAHIGLYASRDGILAIVKLPSAEGACTKS
ncbi:histone-lysine N-methyltransferase SUVR5 isoform X2 [Hevea brasiliensis]|uniref:histone-lysine N-methyltransferase SUVR5 isoform X2 n=1 Tax=Hevea brasiliensis TaxID=3981 RepID=UPI0025E73B14|nr:histone-lysine N-methyltransferase SUVR5 isoform X2 [Hevea brasiliensis]